MKKLTLVIFAIFCASGLSVAQPDTPKTTAVSAVAPVLNEDDRLMQEYMARRQAWVQLRQKAQEEVKQAKTEAEKKRILQKLENEERPLRASAAQGAKQVQAARKAKIEPVKPNGK
jgi:hypothetical protein